MSIIAEISRLLNDQEENYEFLRWSEAELQEYVNDGIAQVAMLKPDAFSKSIDVPLKAGYLQELPKEMTQLIDVLGSKNESGCMSAKPLKNDKNLFDVSRNYFSFCNKGKSRGNYEVKGYSVDPNNPHTIFVNPPVPAGEEASLTVYGVVLPDGDSPDIPKKYHNAVIEWALYRAFGKDLESAADNQLSQQHLQHFYSILQLSQQAEDRLHEQARGRK